jgi:hypothetical protein
VKRWRLLVLVGVLAGAPGCLGSDDDGEQPPARVDSTARFSGERAEVAAVLERWEEAVLADDVGFICRRLFAVEENHGFDDDNGGVRYCERDAANSPGRILAAAGGTEEYDVVAHAIELEDRDGPRLDAQARISAGASLELVTLRTSDEGEWRIISRSFPDAWGKPAKGDCALETELIASLAAPARESDDPREAALEGVFADEVPKIVARGGSFELGRISYRPDYSHVYALQSPGGRLLSAYPVGVWGPRSYDNSSVYMCRGGRLVGIIA